MFFLLLFLRCIFACSSSTNSRTLYYLSSLLHLVFVLKVTVTVLSAVDLCMQLFKWKNIIISFYLELYSINSILAWSSWYPRELFQMESDSQILLHITCGHNLPTIRQAIVTCIICHPWVRWIWYLNSKCFPVS